MENNDNQSFLTKDDLMSALSELMKEKNNQDEKQIVSSKEASQEEVISKAVERYLEKKESQKKAQEILERADNISSSELSNQNIDDDISSSPDELENLRMQLEKHIDNIREMLKYGDYDPGLLDSKYTNKYINARRVFWHCICHNKGGKEGSTFVLNQMRTKGIKHPSAYLLKY